MDLQAKLVEYQKQYSELEKKAQEIVEVIQKAQAELQEVNNEGNFVEQSIKLLDKLIEDEREAEDKIVVG